MHTLFCTDGSKISIDAIYNFSKWSRNFTTDIICAVDWKFLPEDIDIDNTDFGMSCSNLATSILERTKIELEENGINVHNTIRKCGSVTDIILEELEKRNQELVVLGSHGKKGVQKWLGSVSYDVLVNSPVTTFISKKQNCANKVLLAISDKTNSAEHFKNELEKLNLCDKEIHICIVNENPNLLFLEGTLDANWYLKIEKEQKKYAYNIVKGLETILLNMGLSAYKSVIITGNPAEEIINYTKSHSIDLVILDGKRGEEKSKLLSNQTSKRIAENIDCDIMLIR